MNFLEVKTEVETFEEMSLGPSLRKDLLRLGISQPTSIQKKALPLALAGFDLLAIAETGSGKTLTYGLAISTLLQTDAKARALILTPSRETAEQIFRVIDSLLDKLPITRLLVVAGQPSRKQVTELNKLPRVIVATPGRLIEQLQSNKLLLQNTRIMVIDEADRMLDKGFGPQIKSIRSTMRGDYQTMMFGASTNEKALKFSENFFRPEHYLVKSYGAEKPVLTLKQSLVFLDEAQKKDHLLKTTQKSKVRVIIFAKDQPECEEIYQHLYAYDLKVNVIHGGLSLGHRQQVIKNFREELFQILVTTDLLARGLDVADIGLVINYSLPSEYEDFLHRIGRTARAGQQGSAVTYVTEFDERSLDRFSQYTLGAEEIWLRPARREKVN